MSKHPVVDLIAVQTEDPFKILVATILSARTKDEVTAQAADRLFQVAADTVEALARLSEQSIAERIYPVGFYKSKARYLTQLPEALQGLQRQRFRRPSMNWSPCPASAARPPIWCAASPSTNRRSVSTPMSTGL